MTADKAAHLLMQHFLHFEIRRTDNGYQFVHFVRTNIRVPRQFKFGNISQPITVDVPQLIPVQGPCARTFEELTKKVLEEKSK